MKGKHWTVIAIALGNLAAQLHGVTEWSQFTPDRVFGIVASVAATIATFMEKPETSA